MTGQLEPLKFSEDCSVSWYSCGPTVYERAHLGHGVCYVQQDIAIRVLRRKLGKEVHHVMNVTDVDDKLIQRAEEQGTNVGSVAAQQEALFWRDLARLGVQSPTVVTRVSEYMEEIKSFISTLLSAGPRGPTDTARFAYEALDGSGSVYFDRQLYHEVFGQYPTLGAHGGDVAASEDAGATSSSGVEKKHEHDFALWKAHTKETKGRQELLEQIGSVWTLDLPGGRAVHGRPGWHIECSAMCDAVFGKELTIHAGGCDLAFPHHTNEIAQIQALNSVRDPTAGTPRQLLEWPQVFYHVGHLHIRGCKMSKSLKNFITIDDFLAKYSPAHLRLFCLQHHYRSHVEFGDEQMEEMTSLLRKLKHFFAYVEVEAMGAEPAAHLKWSSSDHLLHDEIRKCRAAIDTALLNDFNTPAAMQSLIGLCKTAAAPPQADTDAKASRALLLETYRLVRETLELFGIDVGGLTKLTASPSLGGDSFAAAGSSSVSHEVSVDSLVQELVDMRSIVRNNALQEVKSGSSRKEAAKEELRACDGARDRLAAMGIQLRDFQGAKSAWNWK